MSKEYEGELLRDRKKGELLKNKLPEGEMIVSEGPEGEPLWKKKKRIDEKGNGGVRRINE